MPFDGTDQRKPLTTAEKLQLERLQAGRHRIRHNYQWRQYGGPFGSTRPLIGRCALEALTTQSVHPYDHMVLDCASLLAAQLPQDACRVGVARSDVMRYNDDRSTTHTDILRLYDEAIATLVERQ